MALKFRRGTTAQQSGSLAFGEPYVNTTLGTLLVGGQNGDIVLATTGTGSTGNFGAISGSGLDITGNANIAGNVTIGGQLQVGDQTSDTVNVVASLSSSLIPSATNAFDLGSATRIWRDLYISTGSIKFVQGTNVVKEVSLSTITGLETATGSYDISITNLNSTTASLNTSVSNLNSFSASENTKASTLATLTGSYDTRHTTIGTYTSSLETRMTAVGTATGSAIGRLNNLESTSASVNTSITNLNSFSSSENTKASTLATLTGSYDTRHTTIGTYTSSLETRMSAIGSTTGSLQTQLTAVGTYTSSLETRMTAVGTATGSFNTRFTEVGVVTGSLIASASNDQIRFTTLGSYTSSLETRMTAVGTATGSAIGRLNNLESTSASVNTSVTNLNSYTSSLNAAIGVSGTDLTIKGNLTIQGSQSVINSTTVNIGDNIIQLNGTGATNAGIVVRDATAATTISGSFLWDTTLDKWIAGPLGSEDDVVLRTLGQTLTNKTISGASNTLSNIANASLTNSSITIAGTSTALGGTITLATITGNSGIVSGSAQVTPLLPTGTISGSSQVVYASISSIPAGIVSGAAQITPLLPTGTVSGSSQVIGILSSLNTYTASNDTTNTTQTSRLDQLSTASGSAIGRLNNLETTSASLNTSVSNLNSFSASENTKSSTLASVTASYDTRFTTIGTYTASVDTRFTTLATLTGSYDTRHTTIATYTSSLETRMSAIATYTGSNDTTNTTQNTRLTALEASASTALSTNNSQATSITNLNSATASLIIETTNLELFSSSQLTQNSNLATYTGSVETRFSTLGSLSGSFARTNSTNTFNGAQTISGSLTVTQDFVVLGSSSIQNISSSTLNIGTNLITVAVNQPSVRFGGIAVIDSGSAGQSGSLLYDSVEDEFIFVHRAVSGSANITSSHFLMGPETINNLGNETYLTNNRVPKGTGKEHLNDSNITDSGTLITLGSNTQVNGTFFATGITLVSGSSQIDATATTNWATGIKTQLNSNTVVSGSAQVSHDSTTGYSANRHIDHTAVSITAGSGLTGGGDISATRTLSIATGGVTDAMLAGSISNGKLANSAITIAGTSTSLGGSITLATITGGSGIISGSSQLTTDFDSRYLNTGGDSVVSGSSQIDLTATTNYASGILTRLNTVGVFSGSAQVSHDSTTGYSANRHIDHTAVSITAGNGLTGGGDISATRTLTVDTGSAHFLGGSRAAISVSDTTGANGIDLTYNNSTGVLSGVLANSAITIAGTSTSLGGTITLATITGGSGIISSSATVYSGVSGDITIASNGVATIAANSVALGTDTTGNYMSDVTAGTGVTITHTPGEGSNATIAIGQSVATSASPIFAGLTINGSITATGDITAFFSSDKRFKDNIQNIPDALSKVRKLNGVTWEWNDLVDDVTKQSPNTGLIAQEVQQVLPEVVKERVDGHLGLDYSKMMGLLVEAIKEQQLQIENLKIELTECRKQKGL